MELRKKTEEYMYFAERLFTYLFIVYAILSTNSFFYGTKVISVFMWTSFLLGFLIICYRAVHYKNYLEMPGLKILIVLLFSIIFSTLVNYKYSFKGNVIFCIYWAIYFLIFYTRKSKTTIAEIKKEYGNFAVFFVVYTTISVIVGFILFFTGYSKTFVANDTGYVYYAGFAIGRLTGTFINMNNGAITVAAAVPLMIFIITKVNRKSLKILLAIDISVHLLFIALTDSRSGAVCIGVICGVGVMMFLLHKFNNRKLLFKGLILLLSVLIAVGAYMIPRQMKNVYNNVSILISSNETDETTEEKNDVAIIDRGYSTSGDISNRRFNVWGSAIEIYTSSLKTFMIGTGYSGLVEYAGEVVPDTYILTNDLGELRTLDNEIFNIMVAQGSLGLTIFGVFVVYILILFFKKFNAISKENITIISVMVSVVVGLSVSAMFMGVMFYHFSQNVVVFWISLGSIVCILNNQKVKKDDI